MNRDVEAVEADMADPEAWEAPVVVRRASESRRRSVVISVRVDDAEFEALQAIAERRGVAVSTLMRTAALDVERTALVPEPIRVSAGGSFNFPWSLSGEQLQLV